jgi:hypothetical protein
MAYQGRGAPHCKAAWVIKGRKTGENICKCSDCEKTWVYTNLPCSQSSLMTSVAPPVIFVNTRSALQADTLEQLHTPSIFQLSDGAIYRLAGAALHGGGFKHYVVYLPAPDGHGATASTTTK